MNSCQKSDGERREDGCEHCFKHDLNSLRHDCPYKLHVDEGCEHDGYILLHQEPNAAVPVKRPVEVSSQPILRA